MCTFRDDRAAQLLFIHRISYSIAVRMRTGSLCACALGTRVHYNLAQFKWALQNRPAELRRIA